MYIMTVFVMLKFTQVFRVPSATSPCNLPVNLVKLVNLRHTWSLCLSADGECLAVLQDTHLEIRSKRDK